MTLRLEELITIHPNELYLEVLPPEQEEAWLQTQNYSNNAARWNAYLNQLVLKAFVAYLKEEPDLKELPLMIELNDISASTDSWVSSIWEFVNGTAIKLGNTRLVIIPEEVSAITELCVPQEWVDISSWAADYYIGMQVNLEDGWLRVYGYATHRQLKEKGKYDQMERTYFLNEDDLIVDLNAMWIAQELCPAQKAEIAPLPTLSPAHAENLLVRLGKPSAYSPRLDIPFERWAALLVNDEWRQKLYRLRLDKLPPLHQWFNVDDIKLVEALKVAGWQAYHEVFGWQTYQEDFGTLEAEFTLVRGLVRRFRNSPPNLVRGLVRRFKNPQQEPTVKWVKRIDSTIQPTDYPIALVVDLTQETDRTIWIVPQVRPLPLADRIVDRKLCLPEGLQLTVLDELGEPFIEQQTGKASNLIQPKHPFTDSLGARFKIEITLGDVSVTESFVI